MTTIDKTLSYVLVTPVHNEERHIELTLRSVVAQTCRPLRWVVVDDGSTDSTAEIVTRYAEQHTWIELVRVPPHAERHFASKVRAFNLGYSRLSFLEYAIIGNLDGDISFEPDYLRFLLERFAEDQTLGVAGTVFREDGYRSDIDSFEGETHVAGGCQMFRRECFESVGGFIPNKCGGVDWVAVTSARMKGWRTRSFREKWFFHHRPLGGAQRSRLARAFAYGQKDYYLGGHPLWEFGRSVYQMTKAPLLVGGLALAAGYVSLACRRVPRPVSAEFVRFHRAEQMAKLAAIARSVRKRGRVDPFQVAAN